MQTQTSIQSLQEYAREHPLTRVNGLTAGHFAMIDEQTSVALSLNL